MTYQIIKNKDGSNIIKKIYENLVSFIPFDPANTDYQAYLKWLEKGNEPLPAEETL